MWAAVAVWFVAACAALAIYAFLVPREGDADVDVPEMSPATQARLAALARGERFVASGGAPIVLPDLRDGVPGYLVEGPTAPFYPIPPALASGLDPVIGRDQAGEDRRERLRVMQGGRR